MRIGAVLTALLVSFILFPSCGGGSGDEPHRKGEVVTPGRPGTGGTGDGNATELADATWRYVGPGVELRYDSCGVLFTIDKDGVAEITDIDGLVRVKVRIGAVGKDSIAVNPALWINGTEVKLSKLKMLKQTAESVWYGVTADDGSTSLLVLPTD